jgi:Flp pilus assembly protein TadG
MAVSFVVLVILLFGIIEMGWLFRDKGMMSNAARQAARAAAAGDTPSVAKQKGLAAAVGLGVTISLDKGSADSSGTFVSSGSLGTDQSQTTMNDATPGQLIRATATYNHIYLTGVLGRKSDTLTSQVIMQREQ